MSNAPGGLIVETTSIVGPGPNSTSRDSGGRLGWRSLPWTAQLYVAAVILLGGWALVSFFPADYPQPVLFAILLVSACFTSLWKVNVPISLKSGSTLSMSYAANLMSLLLLGPRHAMVIAVAGVWTQCAYKAKQPYPIYRTIFSSAAEAITMLVSGLTYAWLNGPIGSFDVSTLARPLVGTITTYFLVNTGLIAGVIALSTGRAFLNVWTRDFSWLGAGFMVAGSAGALAAVIVERGEQWQALLLLAPVHLTYRTYELFVGRLDDQKRHAAQTQQLHQQAVAALSQAREAERALAEEKNRLAVALENMTRLETARKQLLAREHAARSSAERANQLKDQFLAMVSHELRTPLTAILGWADLLRRGTLDDKQRDRALQSLYRSARHQTKLIGDLLDLARIISGKIQLERSPIDLESVILDALHIVQSSADAKRIEIGVDVDPAIGTFNGDAPRLQQIVLNLISNAVKFTRDGGVVHVKARRIHHVVEIIVADSGCGIAPEFLPAVFEPFRQADASTTRRQGGLGLGLSIVKHLVEAHAGSVTVESDGEGRGSTFTVRLPAIPHSESSSLDDRLALAPDDARNPMTCLEGVSVLVVDDDGECREVVGAHLEIRGARVVAAASATQAFELLQLEHVDCLLSDIAMPGEDGYTLVRRLRKSESPNALVPAAALSALARNEDRRQAMDAGFQLYLTKPIDERSLVSAVETLIGIGPRH